MRPFVVVLALALVAFAQPEEDHNRTRVRWELLWRRPTHLFAAVEVNKQSVGALLAPLMSYEFLLPLRQLRAGVAYTGARTRLRGFVRDLLAGRRSLRIGVVGGSISWGQGTSSIPEYAWFHVLARWLTDAFPAANITARNGAVPATPSAYAAMCLDLSVDPDVDLVFVEFGVNDGFHDKLFGNGVVMDMERLLRRLLRLRGRPAVVVMQVPAQGSARDPPERPFHHTMEDVEGALSQYYDVPALSLRTALYGMAALQRAEGFRWEQLFADKHPGDSGNRAMADLAVFLLQETALELLLEPWGAEDAARLGGPLPPPMHEGNEPPPASSCIVGAAFERLAVSSGGWAWVNEGSDAKPKWGFVAHQPGAALVVALGAGLLGGVAPPGGTLALHVLHLRSYVHMGVAEMSCAGGCTCARTAVDAHMWQRLSQTYLLQLDVLLAPGASDCSVSVTVLPNSTSGEHKFKVVGVAIAAPPAPGPPATPSSWLIGALMGRGAGGGGGGAAGGRREARPAPAPAPAPAPTPAVPPPAPV